MPERSLRDQIAADQMADVPDPARYEPRKTDDGRHAVFDAARGRFVEMSECQTWAAALQYAGRLNRIHAVWRQDRERDQREVGK